MSTPRQPLPPEIYQRRRAAALVVILVIVAALLGAWLLTRGSAPQKDTAAATSATATASASAVASETTTSAATESPATTSAADESPATESAEPGKRKDSCALEDLIITAALDKPTYNAGEQPVMTMGVENPTAADCIINLDEDVMRFEVYDMNTYNPVWKDTDCFAPVKGGIETFKAGETVEFEASWSRLQSAPDQCVARTPAPTGAYFLHTVIGQHPSEPQTFNLLGS